MSILDTNIIPVILILFFIGLTFLGFVYAVYELVNIKLPPLPEKPKKDPIVSQPVTYKEDFIVSFQLLRKLSNSIVLVNTLKVNIEKGEYSNIEIAEKFKNIYLIDRLYKDISNNTVLYAYGTSFQIYFDTSDKIYFPIVVKRLTSLSKAEYSIMIQAYTEIQNNKVNITPQFIKNLGFNINARYLQLNIGGAPIFKF